ncbi:MAG: peptide ABC transporter ATP-binding protein, partial [Chloroflexi bacterium]|nr:peptide ABC transporter ATP-binding protein [Chloroflexota bacterium]
MTELIRLDHVTRTFTVNRHVIKAVDDVSLTIHQGEV